MSAVPSDLPVFSGVGTLLAGKYRIEAVMGVGGMGVVVSARHRYLETRVAIKFLLPRPDSEPWRVEQFLREGRAASQIRNQHVVRVLDADIRSDRVPYIVMELLEGQTLSALIRRRGRLGRAESVDYVLEACEALAEAHAAGIVHRDTKPANLFLARGGEYEWTVKVLDFGIAGSLKSEPGRLGRSPAEASMGSLPYMSPEQLVSPREVDGRTDVWALGATLFECLTGSSPFASAGVAETCTRILQEEPGCLASFRVEVPPPLEAAIRRCLAKAKGRRCSTVVELARELASYGTERAQRSLGVIEAIARRRSCSPPAWQPPARDRSIAAAAIALDTGTIVRSQDLRPVTPSMR